MTISAAEEFKKNPELKEEDLKHIKDWITKQPHLPQNLTDEMIIIIMHSCYYSLELSKQTLDHYFTLRTHIPEFFTDRDYHKDELQEVYKTAYAIPLDGRTKEGYKVIVCGLRRTDPQYFVFANIIKVMNMVIDAVIQSEGTFPGFIMIIDYKGVKLGHLPRLHLPIMKKTIVYLQDGMPVRLKGLHYINIVPFIDKIMALMKPFMKKELIDMLTLHSEGSTSIFDVVPKDYFPNDLGGKAGDINDLHEKTYKIVTDLSDSGWFAKDELNHRVDETKRPGKAKTAGDLFGLEGSFRKLAVD